MKIEIYRDLKWIEVKDEILTVSRFKLESLDDDEIDDCVKELGDLLDFLGHNFKVIEVE